MAKYEYHLVDVFTTRALEGNALAVFPNADRISAQTMQRLARELNLSETTFVLQGESAPGSFRVRIFTPTYEMTFAGHPTIGTAYVLRALGMVAKEVTQFDLLENIGRVPVRVDGGDDPLLWLTTPPIREFETYPSESCAAALSLNPSQLLTGVPCTLLSAGNPNLYVAVKSPSDVDSARVDEPKFAKLLENRGEPTCMFVFAPVASGAYSRMFAPELGVVEDPATGSATGPLAAFMMKHRLAPSADGTRIISEQGTKMGRRSLLHVLIHGEAGVDGIEVGGNVTRVGSGSFELAG